MPGSSSAAPQHQHGTRSSTKPSANPPVNSSKKDREALLKDGGASKATRKKMTTTKNNLRRVVVAHCEGLLQQFENDHPQVVARQLEYPYSEWLTPGADGVSQEFHNMVEDESRIMWFLWNRPDDPTLSAGFRGMAGQRP